MKAREGDLKSEMAGNKKETMSWKMLKYAVCTLQLDPFSVFLRRHTQSQNF